MRPPLRQVNAERKKAGGEPLSECTTTPLTRWRVSNATRRPRRTSRRSSRYPQNVRPVAGSHATGDRAAGRSGPHDRRHDADHPHARVLLAWPRGCGRCLATDSKPMPSARKRDARSPPRGPAGAPRDTNLRQLLGSPRSWALALVSGSPRRGAQADLGGYPARTSPITTIRCAPMRSDRTGVRQRHQRSIASLPRDCVSTSRMRTP